jgi:hypothetical protein
MRCEIGVIDGDGWLCLMQCLKACGRVLWMVARDVVGSGDVGFSGSMQAGDPAPRERVTGGIGIEEVIEKKLRAEGPVKFEVVNPVGRPPHAGVVVEVAGAAEFVGELIHDGAARVSVHGIACEFAGFVFFVRGERDGIVPNARTLGEPAFPVGAPTDFLEKFFDRGKGVSL